MKAIQTLWCGDRDLEVSPFLGFNISQSAIRQVLRCIIMRNATGFYSKPGEKRAFVTD